jgi:hypothetical protein
MSVELAVIDAYFYQVLSADAVLQANGITGYFSEQAPNQQPVPYILWTKQSAVDVTVVGAIRVGVDASYVVRVVGQVRSYADLQIYADQIDIDLHRTMGTALGHIVESCVRSAPYSQLEDRGDIQWRHLGCIFDLRVQ